MFISPPILRKSLVAQLFVAENAAPLMAQAIVSVYRILETVRYFLVSQNGLTEVT